MTAGNSGERPRILREGDTHVYAIVLDQIVIAGYAELERHFVLKLSA